MWRGESWPISRFVALLWVEVLTKPRKKKLGLGSQCLGSDFNMRHPEKEEIWPHKKFLKVPA
jgi:hypothetical protein